MRHLSVSLETDCYDKELEKRGMSKNNLWWVDTWEHGAILLDKETGKVITVGLKTIRVHT